MEKVLQQKREEELSKVLVGKGRISAKQSIFDADGKLHDYDQMLRDSRTNIENKICSKNLKLAHFINNSPEIPEWLKAEILQQLDSIYFSGKRMHEALVISSVRRAQIQKWTEVILKRVFPKKKFSIYNAERQTVGGIKEHYLDEGHKPTICGEHIVLANLINDFVTDKEAKQLLLAEVDIVYDMGKRMGNKLLDNHKKSGARAGWREDF